MSIANRVMETTTGTGTGTLTLAGAVAGYEAFADGTYTYCIEAVDANGNPSGDYEIGEGSVSSSVLTRTTVEDSSNAGSKVSFTTGTKRVFVTASAGYLGGLGGGTEATAAEIRTGTETEKFISPDKIYDAAAEVTLTDGATVTPNLNSGINFKWTIGGNRTLANPTNAKSGQSGIITITQDGTGGRTLTVGSNYKFPGALATLSTTPAAVDIISYFVRADGTLLCTLTQDVR